MMNNRKSEMPGSPWLTPGELAAYLSVAVGTIRNGVSLRYVPFSRRGRVVRFHKDEIDKWLRRDGCRGRGTIADAPAEAGEQERVNTSDGKELDDEGK